VNDYDELKERLRAEPRHWLVTGAAGFIGSHLVETLLGLGQKVVGVDNFCTSKQENLDQVRALVGDSAWKQLRFIEGDICSRDTCQTACDGVEYVLHQAALGSVPRSVEDPINSFQNNVMGFLTMMVAARDAKVKRFVYASSSSVYGDAPELPKREEAIGEPLSPYAATKYFDEVISGVFQRCYEMGTIGLRYFNVFGSRQDPDGPYAAVIPKWVDALLKKDEVCIYGDGETSRDFCFVNNAVQANLLAATTTRPDAVNEVYNVAVNARTTLNELFRLIRDKLAVAHPEVGNVEPVYRDFRPGDVRHSQADIGKAQRLLGYEPTQSVEEGMEATLDWYVRESVRG